MPSRRHHLPALTRRSAELAFFAPQVIAHRMQRLAAAGATPSQRDSAEFQRMWVEKIVAASESWAAMMQLAYRMNLKFATSMWSTWWTLTPRAARGRLASHATHTASAMLGAGLVPIHRKVLGNARRLGR